MRKQYQIFLLLVIVTLFFPFCRRDTMVAIVNFNRGCFLVSDTTHLSGKSAFSTYLFEPNSNRLKVSKKVMGNSVLLDYREIHYRQDALPDKTVTYVNANEFYETKFFYNHAATQPYKSELYFTNKLNNIDNKNLASFHFSYDAKERLDKVEYTTMVAGERNYILFLDYNARDNVTRLEYEISSTPLPSNMVIMVNGFDNNANPYSRIPYWKFLSMSGSLENYNPELLITALSRNNPLDFTLGDFKRNMFYSYNAQGFPVSRHNVIRNATSESSYSESFHYRCP